MDDISNAFEFESWCIWFLILGLQPPAALLFRSMGIVDPPVVIFLEACPLSWVLLHFFCWLFITPVEELVECLGNWGLTGNIGFKGNWALTVAELFKSVCWGFLFPADMG